MIQSTKRDSKEMDLPIRVIKKDFVGCGMSLTVGLKELWNWDRWTMSTSLQAKKVGQRDAKK